MKKGNLALAGCIVCVVLLWPLSGALAQSAAHAGELDKPAYARAVAWAGEKVVAIIDWIQDGFSRLAALLFGRGGEELASATQGAPSAPGRVLGEEAVVLEPPLDQGVLPEPPGIPSPAPVLGSVPEFAPQGETTRQVPEQESVSEIEQNLTESPAPTTSEPAIPPPVPLSPPTEEARDEKSSSIILVHGADRVPPSSSVSPLSGTTTSAQFDVGWGGQDNRPGDVTLRYDVQYQVDSGDWVAWLSETVLFSSLFTGEDEKTYGFRTRSRDPEGNWEDYPQSADTSTYLNLSVPNDPEVTSHATST
ncbi:MAG: hypothetical protein HYW81_01545, partial [Parcubacteria group bacterium]|nr:hypothetical protein [Parcubacteria group bacterium]